MDADLAAVLPLGDVQYHCGGYQAFLQSYDLSWGRVKDISRPWLGTMSTSLRMAQIAQATMKVQRGTSIFWVGGWRTVQGIL